MTSRKRRVEKSSYDVKRSCCLSQFCCCKVKGVLKGAVVDMTDDVPLATLKASPPRRVVGTGMVLCLGLMMIYLGFAMPIGVGAIVLILLGAGLLAAGAHMWRASSDGVVLTRERLETLSGTLLAEVSQIEKVERGAFAFKPSNGFLVRTKSEASRLWVPGLYWRLGRRIGIGGVTPAPQSKAMAEEIAMLIADRS